MQTNQKSKTGKSKPQKAGGAAPKARRRVSAQQSLKEALRKSDERLQVFFNQSLDGFFFCHFDKAREWKNARNKEEILEDIITTQRFTDVNDAMLKQYNIDRKDFLNLTTRDVFAHDLEQGKKLRRELFDNGRLHLETYERMTDGTPVWFEGDYVCLYDDDRGRVTGFFGIQRDITDRKQSEIALREAEEKYRSIFESAAEGIYQSSPEGRFLTVNPAFARILGFASPEEMIASITDIAHQMYGETAQRQNFMQQIEQHGSITGFEYQMRRKDGSMIWVSENAHAVCNIEGKILYYEGIVEDITGRKENEQNIDKQIKRLNALRTIDSAINASVDLRTTLDILLQEVIAQLKADAAAVLLFNKSTLMLEYATSYGFRSQTTPHHSLGLNEGYAGKVMLERKTLHIPNLTEGGLQASHPVTGRDFTAYIGVPLIAKGQVVGVLEIFQRSPLTPDHDWLNFLDMLAGQTAIAINNAQLFENLQRSNFELTLAYDATIEGWSRALDLRDKGTEGHTQRVTSLTVQLARQMGIPDTDIIHLRRGALLHDIGKMGIPDSILHKPAALTAEEWRIMRRHTIYANEMLASIPYLRFALDIPRHHHEKWDGTGYPYGLKGNEIPLSARIFAVVDVWDALTSDRPYRAAWTKEKTAEYIKTETGCHFDPRVAETFLMLISNR